MTKHMGMVRGIAVSVALSALACSRNDIEAINLTTEGDQSVKVDLDGAISKYEQATKLDPSNHVIFYKLGLAYEKKEAWDKVASTMSAATRLQPKNATYWFKRGKALAAQADKGGSWDEAKEPLEKCIAADPNYDDCYYQLGEVMFRLDDEQRAIENWTKAIQHRPTELVYYAPLADLYINLGYLDQATQVLKEGQAIAKPTDKGVFNLHTLMARVHQAKGDTGGVVAELEKAKASDPEGTHPEILFNLGSTYAIMNPPKKQEAQQMLKAFNARACKGTKALVYKAQCEQSQALIQKLGGS